MKINADARDKRMAIFHHFIICDHFCHSHHLFEKTGYLRIAILPRKKMITKKEQAWLRLEKTKKDYDLRRLCASSKDELGRVTDLSPTSPQRIMR